MTSAGVGGVNWVRSKLFWMLKESVGSQNVSRLGFNKTTDNYRDREGAGRIPHGVRYALTLHEPYGKRILGYDNAHAVKPPKKFKYAGTKLPYDHKHRHVSDKGVPYEFKDAHQLLSDFFVEVDRVLKEARKS